MIPVVKNLGRIILQNIKKLIKSNYLNNRKRWNINKTKSDKNSWVNQYNLRTRIVLRRSKRDIKASIKKHTKTKI